MLRPYKGKERDRRALASLRFALRFITVGRIATFHAERGDRGACFRSAGSMTKVPVKSEYSLATPKAVGSWPSWASILSRGPSAICRRQWDRRRNFFFVGAQLIAAWARSESADADQGMLGR